MKIRRAAGAVVLTAIASATLVGGVITAAQPDASPTATDSGSVPVDGIDVYYEVHGTGEPLVLLQGALTTIDTAFEAVMPTLAEDRMVIAIEQQGHGRTADRSDLLSYDRMAQDTLAVLDYLDIERADFYGYSMGGGIALELAIRHPERVRKAIVASMPFQPDGWYPGVLEATAELTPDVFVGTGLPEAYAVLAPDPDAWPTLVEKVKQIDLGFAGWTPEEIASIQAPVLLVVGDSDTVSVAHASTMFELLGGGVPGDFVGVPDSRLAVLAGTTHIGVALDQGDWLLSEGISFLEAPVEPADGSGGEGAGPLDPSPSVSSPAASS